MPTGLTRKDTLSVPYKLYSINLNYIEHIFISYIIKRYSRSVVRFIGNG